MGNPILKMLARWHLVNLVLIVELLNHLANRLIDIDLDDSDEDGGGGIGGGGCAVSNQFRVRSYDYCDIRLI